MSTATHHQHPDAKTLQTPSVYFSLSQLKHNYHEIVKAFHGIEVFYSVKYQELAATLRAMADAIDQCCPKEECHEQFVHIEQ